jgi:hypothetical protein
MSELYKPIIEPYCSLMEEIKLRMEVVGQCLSEPVLRPRFMYELCFLQFRMICELISLACLVAHGDIAGTRSKWFRKSIDVPAMMNQMERLHPEYYPRPAREVHHSNSEIEWVDLTEGYLTKTDLIELYTRAGEVVHRGSYRKVFEQQVPARTSEEVVRWRDKLVTLLSLHRIVLNQPGVQLWVGMQEPSSLKVHAAVMTYAGENS